MGEILLIFISGFMSLPIILIVFYLLLLILDFLPLQIIFLAFLPLVSYF